MQHICSTLLHMWNKFTLVQVHALPPPSFFPSLDTYILLLDNSGMIGSSQDTKPDSEFHLQANRRCIVPLKIQNKTGGDLHSADGQYSLLLVIHLIR